MAGREERVILDPAEVAVTGRDELDLHSGAIQVREEGIDWGQYEIEAFMAKQQMGEKPIDFALPNRVITIPLILGVSGDFDAARIALQAKVTRINADGGGWLKREIIGGSYGEAGDYLFADIVKATLKYGGGTLPASRGIDPEVDLVLEALPDFYGDWIEGTMREGTGDLSWTEQVKGNLPGRVDLRVVDKSNNNQLGVAWHFRSRNYASVKSARWVYEAEELEPLDAAAQITLTGASGGKAIRHNNLAPTWTPVLGTSIGGTEFLTHQGVYDVWVRAYTTSTEPPWLRLVYDIGDLSGATENDRIRIPIPNGFYLVNLGQVNLRRAAFGTHRWHGAIQAAGSVGGENVSIDRIYLLNADEGSGILRGEFSSAVPSTGYAARDEFNQASAGALAGKEAPKGGTWSEAGSTKGTFNLDTVGHTIQRSALSDSESEGRHAILGTASYTDIAVGATLNIPHIGTAYGWRRYGVFARYSSINFCLRGQVFPFDSENKRWWWQVSRGYAWTEGLGGGEVPFDMGGTPTDILLIVTSGGMWQFWIRDRLMGCGQNSQLVPGGTLETGKIGIVDEHVSGYAYTRTYDNFAAWVPSIDAAVFANQDGRYSSQGHFRLSRDGAAYGPIARPESDLPRIPVSGPEERPVEIGLKWSRGDFEELPDSGLDKVGARLAYRPCFSHVPES